ncbi:type I restriction-modification system endonuclease [Bradyrhizobium barranii subsp. apii]|uniref:Type I restriction-modification system endonuclease n=1 Tax=Bradyrhizobium barranii subsp. apii TaxID=2819348 RepID=A0A8T5V0J5_9BRAD|nr:type I restriction-modification system endonuclease [Bradyrhizobium barranii]UPT87535.1 type I restriction-modification system endonuclease [Bradyrhizobium barranii subsp. apii]
MAQAGNFQFLKLHDARLVAYGAAAERYLHDDPNTAIFKLRQFAELLCKSIAARHALYLGERETFEETLRRLSLERITPREVADVFHAIRKIGNRAVHDGEGTIRDALSALKFGWQLAIWFHRVYGKQPGFKPPPFIVPVAPSQKEIEQAAERLRVTEQQLEDALQALAQATGEARENFRARTTLEEKLKELEEERSVWEALAHEAEQEKLGGVPKRQHQASEVLLSRLSEPMEAFRTQRDRPLDSLQEAAKQAPQTDLLDLVARGEEAAKNIDLDEASTRDLIDQQLRDSGWEADTRALRHSEGARPAKGRNVAIAEWPTASGPADYALFVGLTLIGVVEAKRKRKNVSAAIDQAERYSVGMKGDEAFSFADGRPWGTHQVPFVFAANGRSYLKQIETESGIWFRDTRRSGNHRRALVGWPTPEGLVGQLEIKPDAADAALKDMPFAFGFPLREYQQGAIRAVEGALGDGRRSMLLAMATGTGKTKLAIAMLYRLLETKRFRRVCFVVDRSALGEQAAGEFTTTKVVSGKAFADIFGLKRLSDVMPESETKVHICTIQGLVKRVLYAADSSEAPPVDQYDLMVIDECHRGYLLDREMSDAELSFRGQEDYISKYRRVLEYFDAVKIGLTATPALHTTEIFGDPIFTYSYRQAVIDGFLIDHEPPVRIETALARAGIVF